MLVDTSLSGPLARAAEGARQAEELGYDSVSSIEVAHDGFLPLALAAQATTSITLGTSILVAFSRNPMSLAYSAWDLQQFSGGRVAVGLGSQIKPHIERRFSMPWSRPADRMREYIQAVRAIWACWQGEAPLDFQGEFYRHTLMTPMFMPGPFDGPTPSIWLAGVGARMTEVAAEVADGLLLHGFTTARYVQEVTLPIVERTLAAAGRDRADFQLRYAAFLATGTTDEQTEANTAAVRKQIAFYGSTPAYRPVLEVHGWGDLQTELHRLSRLGEWDTMGTLIDDEVLNAFAVVCPPEQVPSELRRRYSGLAERVGLSVPPGIDRDLERAWVAELKA